MPKLLHDSRRTAVRYIWAGVRLLRSSIKRYYFQALKGAFFCKVGYGTRFFGAVRFGTVEGNISVGTDCLIGHDVFFSARKGSDIVIGNGCVLNTGCHVVAIAGIHIGDGTMIGEYCSIRDQNHRFDDTSIPISEQGFTGAAIYIGSDVWIGRGVFIAPGVSIGDGAVVGANSVVTRDVKPFDIVVGAPARVIKSRVATVPR